MLGSMLFTRKRTEEQQERLVLLWKQWTPAIQLAFANCPKPPARIPSVKTHHPAPIQEKKPCSSSDSDSESCSSGSSGEPEGVETSDTGNGLVEVGTDTSVIGTDDPNEQVVKVEPAGKDELKVNDEPVTKASRLEGSSTARETKQQKPTDPMRCWSDDPEAPHGQRLPGSYVNSPDFRIRLLGLWEWKVNVFGTAFGCDMTVPFEASQAPVTANTIIPRGVRKKITWSDGV